MESLEGAAVIRVGERIREAFTTQYHDLRGGRASPMYGSCRNALRGSQRSDCAPEAVEHQPQGVGAHLKAEWTKGLSQAMEFPLEVDLAGPTMLAAINQWLPDHPNR